MKHLLHQPTLARLTLSMLLALFSVASWGDELTVYDGTVTHNRVPINVYYFDDFSKSQVVFPAEELGEMIGAYINSITFYTTSSNIPYTAVSSADIFLKEVDYTTISAFEDIATGTTVFTGYLEFVQDGSGGKVTIVFNEPYLYNGGNLLIGTQNTEDKGWMNISFLGQTVNGASIYGNNANSLDDVTSVSQANFIPKTTFNYTPDPNAVPTPQNLTATSTSSSITLRWTGGTGIYQVSAKRASDGDDAWSLYPIDLTTQEITLYEWAQPTPMQPETTLQPATKYDLAVRSLNADKTKTSKWKYISCYTDFEEEKCLITLKLHDSYGDGWNGNAIEVSDVESGIVLATATIEDKTSDATVDVSVPVGRNIKFSWISGNFAAECSYTVLDVNEEEIFSGSGALAEPYYHIVDCTVSTLKRPTNVTLSNITATTAEVDWTENGDATLWTVSWWTDGEQPYPGKINTTVKPYTITDLTPETKYTVSVTPAPVNGEYKWSKTVEFTTPELYPTPTDLIVSKITPTSAVASWTGEADNYELQYAKEPVESESLVTIDNEWYHYDNGQHSLNFDNRGLGAFSSAIMLPAGSTNGNRLASVAVYDDKVSTRGASIFIYNDGDTQPEGMQIGSATVNLTGSQQYVEVDMGNLVFDTSKNLWIEFINDDQTSVPLAAQLQDDPNGRWLHSGWDWTDLSDESPGMCWMIRAKVAEDHININNDGWCYYGNGEWSGNFNNRGLGFSGAVMYPAGTLPGNVLTGVNIYDNSTARIGVSVLSGGNTPKEATELASTELNLMGTGQYVEAELDDIEFDWNENLWIVFYNYVDAGMMGLANDTDNEPNGRWLCPDGINWTDLNTETSGMCWMIQAQVPETEIDKHQWTTVNNITSPYTIEGLERGTEYALRVRANYAEGHSKWATTSFTTPEQFPAPTNLAVETDATSATVIWDSSAETFNVRYRKAEFGDGFENGLDNWLNIDADEDGYPWMTNQTIFDYTNSYSDLSEWAYNGNVSALSGSYINGIDELTPDNWLISPEVTLGGTISFYAHAADPSYPADVFGVFVSTEGTDTEKFQEVETWTMTAGDWRIFTADLSQFSGKGYVAIRHYNCYDQYIFLIDNVAIFAPETDDCWTTATSTDNSIDLTGLTAESGYMVQVQAVNDDETSDWSTTIFLTPSPSMPTGIVNVNAREDNGSWYTIDGKKLNARPKAKGLYIHNGQKVVVK